MEYGYTESLRSLATQPEVFIDGVPLSAVVAWGDLETTTRISGDWTATWGLIAPPRSHIQKNPLFRPRARVEVKVGPLTVWLGYLNRPDWDSRQLSAKGLCRQAEGAKALTVGFATTSIPDNAISIGILRGVLGWNWSESVHDAPILGDDDEAAQFDSIAQLLDAAGEQLGWRWYIDQKGFLRTRPYPLETDPEWFVVPDTGVLGSTDVEQVDRIFLRYQDSAWSGALFTTSYPGSSREGDFEDGVSYVEQGPMTSTRAQQIARGLYDRASGKPGWTNGIEVSPAQVMTPGGLPAPLPLIRAGHSIRLLGLPDVRSSALHTDVAIAETTYRWSENVIQLNPEGLVADGLDAAIEAIAPGGVVL